MSCRNAIAAALCAALLAPGIARADGTADGSADDKGEQKGSGPFGVKENAMDATAAVDSNKPGLNNIKFGGYLRPELVFTMRPDALPRDEYEYGIGTSRAGLLIGGEPVRGFHASLHLVLGASTDDIIGAVDPIDRDGDGSPDDIDATSRPSASLAVATALVTWRPDPRLAITVGRRRIPFTASTSTLINKQVFAAPPVVQEAFTRGTDLGIFVTGSTPDHRLIVSGGLWNGSGRESAYVPQFGRGILASARIDFSPLGAMPFEEGDLKRGPPRFSLGSGLLYHALTQFDMAGFEGAKQRDLRASFSARVTARGFYFQTEVLRRQITDNLSSRPDASTAAYAQTSYYLPVGQVGLAPMARFSWLRIDEHVAPKTGSAWEAGLAVYPRPKSANPDYVRLVVQYIGRVDPITGETIHSGVSQLRLRW